MIFPQIALGEMHLKQPFHNFGRFKIYETYTKEKKECTCWTTKWCNAIKLLKPMTMKHMTLLLARFSNNFDNRWMVNMLGVIIVKS